MLRNLCTLLFLLIVVGTSRAQNLQTLVPHVPTSPQAEAFKKYGDYAISHSTGAPDISVPLYEIEHRGFKLPLSLKYNAQPLKPGYNYDVFGGGWSLSISSSVSRTIEYVPDEWKNFVLEHPQNNQYYNHHDPLQYVRNNSFLTDYNYARDKFTAQLPNGSSFDFFIDNVNNQPAFTVSNRQMKVNLGMDTYGQISWFTVIDGDGVKYTFSGSDVPYSGPYNAYANVYVSWQLTRIDLPNTNEPILLTYDYLIQPPVLTCPEPSVTLGHTQKYDQSQSEWVQIFTADRGTDYIPHYYKMKLLSEIRYGTSGDNLIQLSYQNPSGSYYNYVDKIKVFEKTSLLTEIELNMTVSSITNSCNSSQRARLDEVLVKGSDALVSERYACEYHSVYSFGGTDHWGYLTQNPSNMPNFSVFTEWDLSPAGHAVNAQMVSATRTSQDVNPFFKFKFSSYPYDARFPSPPDHHGVLHKLRYPTGGYTEFVYENHKFLSATDANGDYIPDGQQKVPTNAAGFRIRSITNYAIDGVISSQKHYRYGKTNSEHYGSTYAGDNSHTGLGLAVVDPNIQTYMNFSATYVNFFPIVNMVLGLDMYGQRNSFANPFLNNQEWGWECTFSPANFQRRVEGRQPVVYSQVTEYDGEVNESYNIFPRGKTVYKYDLGENEYPEGFFEPLTYYGNNLDYERKSYRYNRLKEKSDYIYDSQIQQFKLIKKQQNNWSEYATSALEYKFMNLYPASYYPSWTIVNSLFTTKYHLIGQPILTGQSTTEYSPTGESITSSELYSYNQREQLANKKIKRSDNLWLNEAYIYPGISSTVVNSTVEQGMVAQNIISPLLQKHTSVIDSSASPIETQIASTKIDYANFGTSQIILPSKSYDFEIKPSGAQYVPRTEVTSYTAHGNPLEVISEEAVKNAYLWGYNDRYMIAEVKNAGQNEVFFSNFEELADWNSNLTAYDNAVKHSGRSSGRIDVVAGGQNFSHSSKWLNISLNGVKKFKYSGWVYSNGPSSSIYLFMKRTGEPGYYSYVDAVSTSLTGQWVYLEKDFEVPADVTQLNIRIDNNGGGSVWFDDIRLHPSDALMITYTHEPLVGMTSMTDSRGETTTYEYDNFQRLARIKDYDGNILKEYCYNYAGQQTTCYPVTAPVASTGGGGTPTLYVRGELPSPIYTDGYNSNGYYYAYTMSDLYYKVYSDASCTQPYTLSNDLNISYRITSEYNYPGGYSSDYYDSSWPITANNSSSYYGNVETFYYEEWGYDPDWGALYDSWTTYYEVMPGTGYQAKPTN